MFQSKGYLIQNYPDSWRGVHSERLSLSNVTDSDLYHVFFETDTHESYRLVNVSPITWEKFGGSGDGGSTSITSIRRISADSDYDVELQVDSKSIYLLSRSSEKTSVYTLTTAEMVNFKVSVSNVSEYDIKIKCNRDDDVLILYAGSTIDILFDKDNGKFFPLVPLTSASLYL